MKKTKKVSGLLYYCCTEVSRAGEHFIADHSLSYILSGNMVAFDGENAHHFKEGDLFLCRKNTLAKFIKYPSESMPFTSVSVILDKKMLWEFNETWGNYHTAGNHTTTSFYSIQPDKLLENYFKSLLPMFEELVSDDLALLKKQEAAMLLLRNSPLLKEVLFDFSMPGKLDLEAFMNQNFKFNATLSQLAYLTGRSLASFKRDFEKLYHMSPNRWMQHKRLQEAHFLITEEKMKPKDVFMEVGFETLSHFSYAFKQQFGVNPSTL